MGSHEKQGRKGNWAPAGGSSQSSLWGGGATSRTGSSEVTPHLQQLFAARGARTHMAVTAPPEALAPGLALWLSECTEEAARATQLVNGGLGIRIQISPDRLRFPHR